MRAPTHRACCHQAGPPLPGTQRSLPLLGLKEQLQMDPGLPRFGALSDIEKGLLLSLFLCQSSSFHLLTALGSIRTL